MSFLSSVILSITPPPLHLHPPDDITILFLDYDVIISMTSFPGNSLHPLHPCAVLSNYYYLFVMRIIRDCCDVSMRDQSWGLRKLTQKVTTFCERISLMQLKTIIVKYGAIYVYINSAIIA